MIVISRMLRAAIRARLRELFDTLCKQFAFLLRNSVDISDTIGKGSASRSNPELLNDRLMTL